MIENSILEIEDSIIGGWDAVMLRIKGQMILFWKQLLRKLLFWKQLLRKLLFWKQLFGIPVGHELNAAPVCVHFFESTKRTLTCSNYDVLTLNTNLRILATARIPVDFQYEIISLLNKLLSTKWVNPFMKKVICVFNIEEIIYLWNQFLPFVNQMSQFICVGGREY